MRHLELRRHSLRMKPSKHLSQEGIDLARKIGASMGRFAFVWSSPAPRACETAVAMGFAVDETRDELSTDALDRIADEIDFARGFAAFADAARNSSRAEKYLRRMAKTLRSFAEELPDGGRGLVVTHGGVLEAAVVGCLPHADHAAWGTLCAECEGARLLFDGAFLSAEILRVGVESPPPILAT